MKHAKTQKIKLGTTEHQAFDHLKPIDVAFGRPIAPFQRKPSRRRLVIVAQTISKILQLADASCLGRLEPMVQPLTVAMTHHFGELTRQAAGRGDFR